MQKGELQRSTRASDLRSRFETLANQQDDRVQQERERRKREDEELRRQNEETERLRQQKIAEQHAKIPEVESYDEEGRIEPTPPPMSARSRASIGVRLPIAPQNVNHAPEPPTSFPKHEIYEDVQTRPSMDLRLVLFS